MNWFYEKKMINVTFEENKIMLLWQKSNNHPSIQKGFFFFFFFDGMYIRDTN